jgi:hypothetical protein
MINNGVFDSKAKLNCAKIISTTLAFEKNAKFLPKSGENRRPL